MEPDREEKFLNQSEVFLTAALQENGADQLKDLPMVSERAAIPLNPVVISDYQRISDNERVALRREYERELGVAYFVVRNPDAKSQSTHPLFDMVQQLKNDLPLAHPLPHPLEGHPEAVIRFGAPDGTVKIYDLPIPAGANKYREQAETSEFFALHHDGLGSGGTVATVFLYTDCPPMAGGYTFFQNVTRLSLDLARSDYEAFRQLFLPDAITILRPRGKGAIRVKTPVLFLNERNEPQSFFRVSSGEYLATWRSGSDALDRARRFLMKHSEPFSYGSTFLHFTHLGHGCLIRNRSVAHGRTDFIDAPDIGKHRCLSRKWYMRFKRDATYKHVPGMFISEEFRELYPELFGEPFLQGEWRYDPSEDQNVPVT
jgi:hypothetical protein